MNGDPSVYRIYGLRLASDFPFVSYLQQGEGEPDLHFHVEIAGRLPDLPADVALAYTSPFTTKDGRSDYAVHRGADRDVLRYTEVADFYVGRAGITAHLVDRARILEAELLLLSAILSYWLERSEVPAIHASAVAVDGQAAAFLASNKGGKSTLAASFMQAGHPLLTDDILPLELRGTRPFGRPGYAQMRFWPDQAAHFLGQYDELPRVHPSVPKRRVRVGPGGWGRLSDGARPLARFYLPERRDATERDSSIELQPVSPLAAVKELIRHSFIPHTVEALGWQPRRLALLARIAERVPMRRLVYPSGVEHLPRIRAAIAEDLHLAAS